MVCAACRRDQVPGRNYAQPIIAKPHRLLVTGGSFRILRG
jgi:hypothetical protein